MKVLLAEKVTELRRKAGHPEEAGMPIEFIGMIGVRPEGADGAAVHVIGGEIDPAWVRDFSRSTIMISA